VREGAQSCNVSGHTPDTGSWSTLMNGVQKDNE